MNPHLVAEILKEMSILIELTDPLPKKAISYRKAARLIEGIEDFPSIVKEKHLEQLPGIGPRLASLITQLATTGNAAHYEILQKKVPVTLLELVEIPGLNPRKVRILYEKLNVKTVMDLKNAIQKNLIQELKIMGPSALRKLSSTIETILTQGFTVLYPKALRLGQSFLSSLCDDRQLVNEIAFTGEMRRKCELISKLDFVATSFLPHKCFIAFSTHPAVREVYKTEDSIQVILKNGLPAELKIVPPQHFIWALFSLTGNEQHVSQLIQEGHSQNLPWVKSHDLPQEELVYSSLGLQYILPELRENRGEIEAAKKGELPLLVEERDLHGAFHCHTTDSDGSNTLEEMVEGALEKGWEYIGISDHSKSSHQANGMDEDRLLQQVERIHLLNKKYKNFRVFSGIECDILPNGDLDFSNEILQQLDFVIVSVHSRFNMEEELMTKRMIKAIENPYTTIIGHLTGRLLRHRPPYAIHIRKIVDACIANAKIIELNSTPSRLDMDWRFWIEAKDKGLLCSINPDAHSIRDLDNTQYGIQMARKGWLEKKDVINTMRLKEMISFLELENKVI